MASNQSFALRITRYISAGTLRQSPPKRQEASSLPITQHLRPGINIQLP
jgi:hypothetical protein